jgi:hypothetical protein
MSNYLKQNAVAEKIANEIIGHESGSLTYNHYASEYNPKILKKEISNNKHTSVDWQLLKMDWKSFL